MKNTLLVLLSSLVVITSISWSVSSAFADGDERCQGTSQNGVSMNLIGNYLADDMPCRIDVIAQGKRFSYFCEGINAAAGAESYQSGDYGGLRVTFYDQNLTAVGWSAVFGNFMLQCMQE